MHNLAYQDLHALEANHWWYRGMRAIYSRLLSRYASPECGVVLDLGCGSGGNLPVLSPYGAVIGVDLAPAALELWHEQPAGLVLASATALPFAARTCRLVTMLGLVEHLDDDVRALDEAGRVCVSGGIVLLNTSAYMLLWSEHDEANRHVRRYRAQELANRGREAGLRVVRLSYANTFLFPVALTVRLAQRFLRRRSTRRVPRVDMFPVPEPLNRWLVQLLRLEAWLMDWIDMPFGVSILAVLTPDRQGESECLDR
jgi:SAM-dependent methyltransferase